MDRDASANGRPVEPCSLTLSINGEDVVLEGDYLKTLDRLMIAPILALSDIQK